MDLLSVAPDIQEGLVFSNMSMLPRELFAIVRRVRWSEQRLMFDQQSNCARRNTELRVDAVRRKRR
jgi:hypothetical protein